VKRTKVDLEDKFAQRWIHYYCAEPGTECSATCIGSTNIERESILDRLSVAL